ncbi:MAG: hypothetical protein U0264_07865 [Candidatus Kapaibacterium sp.]
MYIISNQAEIVGFVQLAWRVSAGRLKKSPALLSYIAGHPAMREVRIMKTEKNT